RGEFFEFPSKATRSKTIQAIASRRVGRERFESRVLPVTRSIGEWFDRLLSPSPRAIQFLETGVRSWRTQAKGL
ncbi:MAG: hypothetical protein ABUK17_11210, partial [Syntrophobacteria bacterium]